MNANNNNMQHAFQPAASNSSKTLYSTLRSKRTVTRQNWQIMRSITVRLHGNQTKKKSVKHVALITLVYCRGIFSPTVRQSRKLLTNHLSHYLIYLIICGLNARYGLFYFSLFFLNTRPNRRTVNSEPRQTVTILSNVIISIE